MESSYMRICTAQELQELDQIAEKQYGISPQILMENAGRAASQILLEKYPDAGVKTEILILAGKGNNAGDAFVVARRLLGLGKKLRVFFIPPNLGKQYAPAVEVNFQILKKLGAKMAPLENIQDFEDFLSHTSGPFTVIDGLLGTGLRGGLEGLYYDLVEAIRKLNPREVIALDIPTGVNGDTGVVQSTAIQAHLTVSFGFPKMGHFLAPGAAKRGELVNVDITLPHSFRKDGKTFLINSAPLGNLLIDRNPYAHKNTFGHALLIGGSKGHLGAIEMSARSCQRMGVGLTTAATWPEYFELLMARLPSECMAISLEDYQRLYSQFSAVVVGPGLSQRTEGKKLLEDVLTRFTGPVVLDADALNIVAEHKLYDWIKNRKAPTVLTPHLGEMARLLGVDKEQVSQNLITSLQELIDRTHAIVVLKGAATLISSPNDKIFVNHAPNDGMATAGSGDVLSGMIGGLLCGLSNQQTHQKFSPFEAVLLGVRLHSIAGKLAAERLGHYSMTAGSIIEEIHHAFKEIKNQKSGAATGRAYIL